MKIWYFENTHRDESNDILYDIIYLCILVEKHSQSKLGQNCTFSNESSIAGRREYISQCQPLMIVLLEASGPNFMKNFFLKFLLWCWIWYLTTLWFTTSMQLGILGEIRIQFGVKDESSGDLFGLMSKMIWWWIKPA